MGAHGAGQATAVACRENVSGYGKAASNLPRSGRLTRYLPRALSGSGEIRSATLPPPGECLICVLVEQKKAA